MYSMAQFFYEDWFTKDVSPHLTRDQKLQLAQKISELTLRETIWMDRDRNFIEDFAELKPFSHSGRITGLQLVTVMKCCLKDLQGAKGARIT